MSTRFGHLGLLLTALFVLAGCNDSGLVASPASIVADPNPIDFGLQYATEATQLSVQLRNAGGRPLEVEGISLEGTNGTQIASELSFPKTVAPNDSLGVTLVFAPGTPGPEDGELVVVTSDADNSTFRVPVLGRGYLDYDQNDVQGEGNLADLMFVVDNSGSMSDDQTKLANSFDTFINWLTGHGVSYQIGVTTTDMSPGGEQGAFVGAPTMISNTTPNVIQTFKNNVQVGDSGAADELGLDAAVAALNHPANAGFLRPAASLYIIYVSDEDDQSSKVVDWYKDYFPVVKDGDASRVFHAAIAGPVPDGCTGGEAAPRYNELINVTGGLFGSICDSDFGVTLQNLAFEITEPSAEFFLEYEPDPDTIEVYVEEVAVDYWTYNPDHFSIVFDSDQIPANGAAVRISYRAIDQAG